MTKNSTYEEIAKKAKVSVSTVSRFYNNGYVSEKNKNKINEIVLQHDLGVKHFTRINKKMNNQIYFLIHNWTDNDTLNIIAASNTFSNVHNKSIYITNCSAQTQELISKMVEILIKKPYAIVLFFPIVNDSLIDFINKLSTETKIVIYGEKNPKVNSIFIDYKKMIYSLGNIFLERNNKDKLALIIDSNLESKISKQQIEGFISFCEQKQISCYLKYFDNRNFDSIKKLVKNLKKLEVENVISSTHDVFLNLLVHQPEFNFFISDIGYQSIFDYNKKYFVKVFIDYHLLVLELARLLNNEQDIFSLEISPKILIGK
ncbi:Conserved hypothetical protein [Mycoplasmopsis pulmonis]|uniref:HTH lacI-type domain-containing protein n=1 Tax=Mycoplasmopsis pulmonis (strain UAB CTIP) TaxID=272635 RepID=Q98PU7_MYCPU|nr:LacI family DNA-binding transcriptional regulator [Mycoplasmopsis pulmonis]MDZ7293577.1 LacI family transcriptional regulator [Mycoplasmopsis pulmonis]CAC13795.1 Conserved hypothetical protein [Mycoplasmopsis pulmonis]